MWTQKDMKVAVMQPYFFPYIAYWQLYYFVDMWVILDEVQFRKFSWMRRNRILHNGIDKELQYINIPVRKHDQKIPINKVRVNNDVSWRDEIKNRLHVYKKLNAGYYAEVTKLVSDVIDRDNLSLTEVMINTLDALNSYLDMETEYVLSSDIDFNRNEVKAPDEWSLYITDALGGDQYINPPGGMEIYESGKFNNKGIELLFLIPEFREYPQSINSFIPGLSIIDVLMFNNVGEIRDMLKSDFVIVSAGEACRKAEMIKQ